MTGAGFRPAKRRRPEPTDWEELDGQGGRSRAIAPAVPVIAEVAVLALPSRSGRLAAPHGPETVAVVGARGGCGRTTIAALLWHLLAGRRPETVTAVDAVPDFGDLGRRVGRRVTAGLDGAPGGAGIVVVDAPAGASSGPLPALLAAAGQLVVVVAPDPSGGHRDVRLLDWLDVNGHGRLVRQAVAVLNERDLDGGGGGRGTGPLAAHLAQRCRAVVRLPRDRHLATGGPVDPARLGRAAGRAGRAVADAVLAALDDRGADDAAIEELVEEIQLSAVTAPGYLGAGVEAPSAARPAWLVALAFGEPGQLQAWRNSPARSRCYEEARRCTGGAFATGTVVDVPQV